MESLFLLAFGEEKSLAAPAMTGSEAFFNKLLKARHEAPMLQVSSYALEELLLCATGCQSVFCDILCFPNDYPSVRIVLSFPYGACHENESSDTSFQDNGDSGRSSISKWKA